MSFGYNRELAYNRNWALHNLEIDMQNSMEQNFPLEVVSRNSCATHSRALHHAVAQRPLRYDPWRSNIALGERPLCYAHRRSSIALTERLLRSAAQRCSVAQIECNASERYKYAQAERALRYSARRFRDSLHERSMCCTRCAVLGLQRRRRLVVLFECSMQYTVPRRCVTTLIDGVGNYFPGRYSIVNAPGLTFYHRVLRGQEYARALYFHWAVQTGVTVLILRSAHVNYLEVRVH